MDLGKAHHWRDHSGELGVHIEHIRAHWRVGGLPTTSQFSNTIPGKHMSTNVSIRAQGWWRKPAPWAWARRRRHLRCRRGPRAWATATSRRPSGTPRRARRGHAPSSSKARRAAPGRSRSRLTQKPEKGGEISRLESIIGGNQETASEWMG